MPLSEDFYKIRIFIENIASIYFLSLIYSFSDRRSSFWYTSVVGNLVNSKSISGDIDRDIAECRANKSVDDGVRQVNWLELLSAKTRKRDTKRGKNSFPA